MNNPRKLFGAFALFLFVFTLEAQTGTHLDSSCNAGGEIWVCGKTQVLQAHRDFDNNCSEWQYDECTVLKVVVDYCSPNMSTSEIFEEGGPGCPLNNY